MTSPRKGASKMEMGFPRPFIREIAKKLNISKDEMQYLSVTFSVNTRNESIVTFTDNSKTMQVGYGAYWLQDKQSSGTQTDLQLLWAQVDHYVACTCGIEQLVRPNKRNYQFGKVYPLLWCEMTNHSVVYFIQEAEDYKTGMRDVMSPSSKNNIIDFTAKIPVQRHRLLQKTVSVPTPAVPEEQLVDTPAPSISDASLAINIAKEMPEPYRSVALEAIVDKIKKDVELQSAIREILS